MTREQQVSEQLADVEHEYAELRESRGDSYRHYMAVEALGLAIQELRRVVDAGELTSVVEDGGQ